AVFDLFPAAEDGSRLFLHRTGKARVSLKATDNGFDTKRGTNRAFLHLLHGLTHRYAHSPCEQLPGRHTNFCELEQLLRDQLATGTNLAKSTYDTVPMLLAPTHRRHEVTDRIDHALDLAAGEAPGEHGAAKFLQLHEAERRLTGALFKKAQETVGFFHAAEHGCKGHLRLLVLRGQPHAPASHAGQRGPDDSRGLGHLPAQCQ